VLHVIFSSDKRLQEIFFQNHPTPPPPPQELNGRPLNTANCSDGSRPSDKWGGGHPDPEMGRGGGLQKTFFRPFRPHFGWKIRGDPGPPGPLPGSATELIHIARGIQMGHYCSLRKKSCTETKHVPMPSLFLWIRLQQRTLIMLLILIINDLVLCWSLVIIICQE